MAFISVVLMRGGKNPLVVGFRVSTPNINIFRIGKRSVVLPVSNSNLKYICKNISLSIIKKIVRTLAYYFPDLIEGG